MNIESYRGQFDLLFENTSEIITHYSKRGYWISSKISENSILFLGLNPSHPHKDYDEPRRIFYDAQALRDRYIDQLRKSKQQIVNGESEITWSHYDLLILRETNQSKIRELSRTDTGKRFILENLAISREVLEKSRPKVVIVVNTFSRDLLCSTNWCNYTFNWDDQIGTYRFGHETKLAGTPVFFSGMLSGQRALDRGSRKRLHWQVRKALLNV